MLLFFQENEEISIVPLYQTVQGAIEAKSESCGVLMANGEVISLGKTIGWTGERKEVDGNIVEAVRKALGI